MHFASDTGDMGGSIGLCLGGSLLTLFEIVDLLIFIYLVKPKKIHPAQPAMAAAEKK